VVGSVIALLLLPDSIEPAVSYANITRIA
jgi:hypothetical protein